MSKRFIFASLVLAVMILIVSGNGSEAISSVLYPNDVGDQVHQITVPIPGAPNWCSIGLTFDGEHLYYDICRDDNIYMIDPMTGALIDTFKTNIPELPNAIAFDYTRNGIWIGSQNCSATGMPIYFWDLDDDTVTKAFTIPAGLQNPATNESFLRYCFVDGLAFDANNPTDPDDDELWFTDDVDYNLGVFRTNGTLLRGYDARTVDPSLSYNSGLAIGGNYLYLGNNGGGDVFRANKADNPLTLADQFTSGDDRQEDMACDPITFAPTEVMWVRTTPQGGQFPDVITAYEIEKESCGFGGAPPDTDGDGLFDDWENDGYDFDGDGQADVDLPGLGADPMRKDIFVEIDWMDARFHDHRPDDVAINAIVDAFADAPVNNPDGSTGITLHVDYENDDGANGGGPIPHQNTIGSMSGAGYDWSDFDDIKETYFAPERAPIFHYAVFSHYLDRVCGFSGISRGITASDFIVSLGGYTRLLDGDFCDPLLVLAAGHTDQQAGTFMHELGHNLSLRHGGNDDIRYKPNYLSVMNYSFQFRGLHQNGQDGTFDYSRFLVGVPSLVETDLHENLGLTGGGIPNGYGTRRFNCSQAAPEFVVVANANGPIDWNCNGTVDADPVQANVNGDSYGQGNYLDDETLSSWHDWANIKFQGGLIGLGAAADDLPQVTEANEMTPEEAAQIQPSIDSLFTPIVLK